MPRFCGRTDPGKRYELNEDAIGWDLDASVWLVADGMGGHASGEIASGIARDAFLAHIANEASLLDALHVAHRAIADAASANEQYDGMGSTLVTAKIDAGYCDVTWVGDSRAYLWRGRGGGRGECHDRQLRQISTDHSMITMLLRNGTITPEQARDHPQRNVVTQSLGIGDPQPDSVRAVLATGDWVLLCSDGLNDELTDDEIAEVLGAHAESQSAADALVAAALDHGGRDNVSVVLVEYDGPSGVEPEVLESEEVDGASMPWTQIIIGAGGAIVAALIAVLLLR